MQKHFFIVDDDEEEIQLIMDALSRAKADCTCTWARNGEQALKQLKNLQPDVIFIDYNMRGMNGLQCLHAVKSIPEKAHIPVVLHSTTMTEELRTQGMQLGAYACLQKADSLDKLMAVLQQFASKDFSVSPA